jgi:hypothetical protein
MSILLDKDIREIFIPYHQKRFPESKLLSEVRINDGLAIADLVSVGDKTSHCYEIKSDKDKISRVLEQAKSYDTVFNKISLITTINQYEKALETIPEYWGIVIVNNTPKNKVQYMRKASASPLFSKQKALLTLWREELLKILLIKNIVEKSVSRLNRKDLIDILSSNLSNTEVCKLTNYFLLTRQYEPSKPWIKVK